MKKVRIDKRAFNKGVDEVLTMKPIVRAFKELVGVKNKNEGRRMVKVGRDQRKSA